MPQTPLPIGSIIGYVGGCSSEQLQTLGWYLCDGSAQSRTASGDLYAVLGGYYGDAGPELFFLPKLNDSFLRGTDPDGSIDPDADERVARNPGGPSGAAVGSFQTSATALAKNSFMVEVDNFPQQTHRCSLPHVISLPTRDLMEGHNNLPTVTATTSGAAGYGETVPKHAAIAYYISCRSDSVLPAGAVFPYVGSALLSETDIFALCDGQGTGTSTCTPGGQPTPFAIPDHRGLFLLGADRCGPMVSFTTGMPNNPFFAQFAMSNTDIEAVCGYPPYHDLMHFNPGGVTLSVTGGDAETRPVNIYADFYVTLSDAASLPVGAVIAFPVPTSTPPESAWLPCQGQLLNNQSDTQYGPLGAILGVESGLFNLPDYRGQFLRGTDRGAGNDPDVGARTDQFSIGTLCDATGSVQDYATASFDPAISATLPFLPSESGKACDSDEDHHVYEWPGSKLQQPLQGGDNETRPANTYVDFYVLYQSAGQGVWS